MKTMRNKNFKMSNEINEFSYRKNSSSIHDKKYIQNRGKFRSMSKCYLYEEDTMYQNDCISTNRLSSTNTKNDSQPANISNIGSNPDLSETSKCITSPSQDKIIDLDTSRANISSVQVIEEDISKANEELKDEEGTKSYWSLKNSQNETTESQTDTTIVKVSKPIEEKWTKSLLSLSNANENLSSSPKNNAFDRAYRRRNRKERGDRPNK